MADVTDSVRVVVVDDDPLVRAAIAMILGPAAGVDMVGEAADGAEVLSAVDRCAPDVVLMDIRMPRVDGLAATELLRARPHSPEIIVLTTFDADEYVLRAPPGRGQWFPTEGHSACGDPASGDAGGGG